MSIKAACKPLNMGLQAALSLVRYTPHAKRHKYLTIVIVFAASKFICLHHAPNTER